MLLAVLASFVMFLCAIPANPQLPPMRVANAAHLVAPNGNKLGSQRPQIWDCIAGWALVLTLHMRVAAAAAAVASA